MSANRRGKSGRGCLPWVLLIILIGVWAMRSELPRLEAEYFDPGPGNGEFSDRSPRRPYPKGGAPSGPAGGDEYVIQDEGPPTDSQGTAFVIDRDGVWLTAEHVTRSCDRFGFRGPYGLQQARRVLESREADVSLVRDGPDTSAAFAVSDRQPRSGDRGYHMGFPSGRPTVVASRFIGTASARRGSGSEPIYAWAEVARYPDWSGELGGISGGPTFTANGTVIGINSAASIRRGRVLTTDPRAIGRLVEASGQVDENPTPLQIRDDGAARAFFQRARSEGQIVEVICDVN